MTDGSLDLAIEERFHTALRQLWERSEYDRGFISNPFAGDDTARLGLKRTYALLERLGRPHDRYRIVHVAGSKGKGSTCAFARGILTAAGYRTGLYASPHLHSFRERISVDGEPIAKDAFAAGWERALRAAKAIEAERPELGRITAFELTTAMALDCFAAAGCDAAVVEVGLGGTLDATNVVAPASTAIAALDYEHTAVLGSTMAEIAANKAGIVKPGVPLATAALPPEAHPVVAEIAARNAAPWLLAGRDWTWRGTWRSFDADGPWGSFRRLTSALAGAHQVDNACLALAAVWQMLRDELTEDAVRAGLAGVRWPGRFEVVAGAAGGRVVLDGAHTAAAAEVLTRTYREEFPGERPVMVLGLLRGKDPVGIARALATLADRFVAVAPPGPRALPAGQLTAAIEPLGVPTSLVAGLEDALRSAAGAPVLVTGSLSTVAAAREALGLATADPVFAE